MRATAYVLYVQLNHVHGGFGKREEGSFIPQILGEQLGTMKMSPPYWIIIKLILIIITIILHFCY